MEPAKPAMRLVKRPNVFPLNKINKQYYGKPSLTKE